MNPPASPLPRLARIAALVAAIDLITKQLAQRWIGGLDVRTSQLLQFGVVHNDKAAFGIAYGPYTFELNLALTTAAILLILPVCYDLARIDRHATTALGLIGGGALGNLTSLLISRRGVVDFIAVGTGPGSDLVLNVADVAAYAGLAILARTGFLIIREMRSRPAATMLLNDAAARYSYFGPSHADAEVARPVFRDDVAPVVEQDVGRRTPSYTEIVVDTGRPVLADVVPVRPLSVRQAEEARHVEASSLVRPMSHPEARA